MKPVRPNTHPDRNIPLFVPENGHSTSRRSSNPPLAPSSLKACRARLVPDNCRLRAVRRRRVSWTFSNSPCRLNRLPFRGGHSSLHAFGSRPNTHSVSCAAAGLFCWSSSPVSLPLLFFHKQSPGGNRKRCAPTVPPKPMPAPDCFKHRCRGRWMCCIRSLL